MKTAVVLFYVFCTEKGAMFAILLCFSNQNYDHEFNRKHLHILKTLFARVRHDFFLHIVYYNIILKKFNSNFFILQNLIIFRSKTAKLI